MSISFDEGAIPDTAPDGGEIPTPDLSCQTCGEPLVYSGRGRKPKFCDVHKRQTTTTTSAGRRASTDVESALAVLDTAYGALSMALLMAGAPNAAGQLSSTLPSLRESNKQALTANRDLAKQINKLGKGGGTAGFYIANGMALGGVIKIAIAERNAGKPPKVKVKTPKAQTPNPATPNPRAATVLDGVVPDGFAGPPEGFF